MRNISGFVRKLALLAQVKKIWRKPPKAKVLIYDRAGSELMLRYLSPAEVHTLDVRKESINVPVLIKSRFSRGRQTYEDSYIEAVDPKVILTFIDNAPHFYELKRKHPGVSTVFIQNGVRSELGDVFSFLKETTPTTRAGYEVDHMLCFGKAVGNRYLEYIRGNIVPMGSFKNNAISLALTTGQQQRSVVFLSQFRKRPPGTTPWFYNGKEAVYWDHFFAAEKFIFPLLEAFCKDKGLNLEVCGCLLEGADEEQAFFAELGTGAYTFVPRSSSTSSYELVDASGFVVMIDSTLGYESLARNKRVAACTLRGKLINSPDMCFGWPAKLPGSGPFWISEANETDFNRVMRFITECSDEEWSAARKEYTGDVIVSDPGNLAFKSVMKNLGVSIQ